MKNVDRWNASLYGEMIQNSDGEFVTYEDYEKTKKAFLFEIKVWKDFAEISAKMLQAYDD